MVNGRPSGSLFSLSSCFPPLWMGRELATACLSFMTEVCALSAYFQQTRLCPSPWAFHLFSRCGPLRLFPCVAAQDRIDLEWGETVHELLSRIWSSFCFCCEHQRVVLTSERPLSFHRSPSLLVSNSTARSIPCWAQFSWWGQQGDTWCSWGGSFSAWVATE